MSTNEYTSSRLVHSDSDRNEGNVTTTRVTKTERAAIEVEVRRKFLGELILESQKLGYNRQVVQDFLRKQLPSSRKGSDPSMELLRLALGGKKGER